MIDRGIVVAPFVSCHSEFPPRSAAHSNQYYLISINQSVNPCVYSALLWIRSIGVNIVSSSLAIFSVGALALLGLALLGCS